MILSPVKVVFEFMIKRKLLSHKNLIRFNIINRLPCMATLDTRR